MENCISICKYHPESPEEAYSNDSQADHYEYSSYTDDNQYFDIDITLPFSPRDISPTSSSSSDKESEDEFELDLSFCNSNPPNPNQCISATENFFYQGQSSSNIPGVKTQFPNLLRTAGKLKISFFRFRKSAKLGRDLQSPCAEYGTAMDSSGPKQSILLTVKLKVVEVPLVSLFTRDESKGANNGFQKKSENSDDGEGQICKSMDRDKKRAKEIVQKYVNKIKLLYVKSLQRYNEKTRSRDLDNSTVRNGVKNGRCQGSERSEKHISFSCCSGNRKMVYNHLSKGKQQLSDMQQKLPKYNLSSEKTLMEMQSSIQEAIAYCKQSNSIDG